MLNPAGRKIRTGVEAEPMKKRPVVVVTRHLPDVVETRMCELFDTRLNLGDKPLSPADLAAAVGKGGAVCAIERRLDLVNLRISPPCRHEH